MPKIITPDQFDFIRFKNIKVQSRKRGNPGHKNPRRYKDIVTAFDIETTRLPEIEQSILYVWQWAFGPDLCVVGRTWEELREFIAQLVPLMDSKEEALVVLVHNLSYEFQFLRTIYEFTASEVFAVDSRKVLKCTMYSKRLEFRCTYLHSNMNLAQYTHKWRVPHAKLTESEALEKYGISFDYSERRFPWTPLNEMEMHYITHDVIGLVEAYQAEMLFDGDNISSMPLTSTGYVRRDVKHAMTATSHSLLYSIQPDADLYRLMREVFRGGDTHANRYYAGHILNNVKSADRSSSYPDVICNCDFPMSPFKWVDHPTFEMVQNLLQRGKALMIRVAFTNLRQSNPYWGDPYIPYAKSRNVVQPCLDNGRILSAAYLETSCTDIDFKIILETYAADDIEIIELAHARYAHLPRPLVQCCIDYYTTKTSLKGAEDGSEDSMLYDKSKALLNSIYGLTAQDIVKGKIKFTEQHLEENPFIPQLPDVEMELRRHNPRAFLAYQWGCWVTAWARYRLYEGIKLAGLNFVYADTDSVKYIGDVDFTDFNAQRIKDSTVTGAWADDRHGNRNYMGVYEQERDYTQFITLGAKKYAYTYEDGAAHVTVSGVNKSKGGPELDAHGGLAAFKEGFIFRDAGGTESLYNDRPDLHELYIDGGRVEIGPNIVIRDSEYTLGTTDDYKKLLHDAKLFLDMQRRKL